MEVFQNVEVEIWHTMFYHSDGFIYAATGDYKSLLKINPETGDTSRVNNSGWIIK